MFIPRETPNTIILKRSYETREGTFTAGHRFEKRDYMLEGKIVLVDSDCRILLVTPYELERLT